MIRDPSDGSVREGRQTEVGIPTSTVSKPTPGPDTGLRQPTRTDAQERLEGSRKWIKDYQEKRNVRGNDGEELQATGHSVEDVRKAEPGAPA